MAIYKVLYYLALVSWLGPSFTSPSHHSPDLATLVMFHKVHYLCTRHTSALCDQAESKSSLTCFFLREADSALESKLGPLFITSFIA